MMTQPISLIFQLVKVIALIRSNVLVRSVCLKDVLAFYHKENNAACRFRKDNITNLFIDNTTKCQINCPKVSLDPSYAEMDATKWYKLDKLEIRFSSTPYIFKKKKSCKERDRKKLDVKIYCEGKYLQGRGIGESCVNDNQCASVTVNSTCNGTTGVCQCKPGHLYLWENNTCSSVQELGGLCHDSRQCKGVNQYSMCSIDNQCECQQGYTKLNSSCLSERRLNETCDDDIQCSLVTPNSTCNKTTKVCECLEGHLEMLNVCVNGRSLMEGISNHCKRVQLSIENLVNKNMEQTCSMISEAFQNTCEEAENNSNFGLVIVIGLAGLVIGIAICGAVYFIVTRHRTKSQNRTNTVKEEINQPISVEVSNAVMNSTPIHHKNERCDTSIAVKNDVYNHLHEDPSKICIRQDYDHVPQLGTEDDDYSHLATCNSTNVDSHGEYGVVN